MDHQDKRANLDMLTFISHIMKNVFREFEDEEFKTVLNK